MENKPNWSKMVSDLQAVGMSQSEIGAAIGDGKSQAWVSALSKGEYKDIKWTDATSLIALHAEKVRQAA